MPDVEEAIVMFKCGEMEKRKFQIKHARALLAVVFGKNLKKSTSKKILLQELDEQSDTHPDRIDNYLASIHNASVSAAAMTTTPTRDDDKNEEDIVTQLLFDACVEEVKLGNYLVSVLDLAVPVLQTVNAIASAVDYDSDVPLDTGDILYVSYFYSAFDETVTTKRNNDFAFMMAEKVHTMIHDDDLSKKSLREVFKKHLDCGHK